MENVLRRLIHLLLAACWLGAAALAGLWYLPSGIVLLGIGAVILWWGMRKGTFDLPAPRPRGADDELTSEQAAKYLVTQVLRNLTRVQVSYLCQDFKSRTASRAWLKKALPRSFHSSLDEVHSGLENARLGHTPPGMKIALQVFALRERLQRQEEALAAALRERPGYSVAHPVVFIVTEGLTPTDTAAEPRVLTLAGWNPAQPTLLPHVDAITFYSDGEQGKQVRGLADFDAAVSALAAHLERLGGDAAGSAVEAVYAVGPVPDPAQRGVHVDKVPLGFVIGAAEMV